MNDPKIIIILGTKGYQESLKFILLASHALMHPPVTVWGDFFFSSNFGKYFILIELKGYEQCPPWG